MKPRCVVCKSTPTDIHHIRSRGAGGTDDDFNLINLCRRCHSKVHQIGMIKMMYESAELLIYLSDKGWVISEMFGVKKLVRNSEE
jgi:hypothetical protein